MQTYSPQGKIATKYWIHQSHVFWFSYCRVLQKLSLPENSDPKCRTKIFCINSCW